MLRAILYVIHARCIIHFIRLVFTLPAAVTTSLVIAIINGPVISLPTAVPSINFAGLANRFSCRVAFDNRRLFALSPVKTTNPYNFVPDRSVIPVLFQQKMIHPEHRAIGIFFPLAKLSLWAGFFARRSRNYGECTFMKWV